MGCACLRKSPTGGVYPNTIQYQGTSVPTTTTYNQQHANYQSQMQSSAVQRHQIYADSINKNQIQVNSHYSTQQFQPHSQSYATPVIQLPPPSTYSQQIVSDQTKVNNSLPVYGKYIQTPRQFYFPPGPSTQEYYQRKLRK